MTAYNYEEFSADDYHFHDFPGPKVGEPLPEITLTTLEGEEVQLSDFRGKQVVLETGSITCPMYVKDVKKMKAVVDSHPDTTFIVMYVREAHPGPSIPAHSQDEMKRAWAARLEETVSEGRTVLVDDVEGTAHQLLGSFPNMVYIVDPDGIVSWRTNWSDTKTVSAVLGGSATSIQLRRDIVPPSRPTPWLAVRVLLRAGTIALVDFVKSLPALMRSHKAVKRAVEAQEKAAGL